jgi:predicted GNAT family N-acyltransferase
MGSPLHKLEFVELGRLSFRDWARLIDGEPSPFGATTAALEFRPKDHHVAIRDERGDLVAAAGATVATVSVGGHDPFEVVGYGALIVRADVRGRQLSGPLMDRLRMLADQLGPDRAMLFCEPHLVRLYSRRGYREITAPVWVDQPSGPVRMPMRAMWRPLRPAGRVDGADTAGPTDPVHLTGPARPVAWPPGIVRLDGLPF